MGQDDPKMESWCFWNNLMVLNLGTAGLKSQSFSSMKNEK